jgi:hypothetical protein
VATTFDFHTLSITVDQPLEEYIAGVQFGLHSWEGWNDRSKTLRWRHEHAHFASFLASGLSDLYGVFADYTLVLLYAALRSRIIDARDEPLILPLVAGSTDDQLPPNVVESLNHARDQIVRLTAFFFGFETETSLGTLVNLAPQDDYWALCFDLRFSRIVKRFYRLIASLAANSTSIASNVPALPQIHIRGQKSLSARAVMEEYAITIELLNTHFRWVKGSFTTYSELTVRTSSELYTRAIEYLLEQAIQCPRTTLDEFLRGKAKLELYHLVAALSFAAMQVPVLQELEGEVQFGQSLLALSPAHRFQRIVEALRKRELRSLPWVRGKEYRNELMAWLSECYRLVGDAETLAICETAHDRLEGDAALRDKPAHEKSRIELSWAARQLLCSTQRVRS